MSKKLKIRPLELKKLPYNRYKWIIVIKQDSKNLKYAESNDKFVRPLIEILENSASGSWKCDSVNRDKGKLYTKIYLTHSMDVAILKMCHSEIIGKIYQIKIKETLL